MILNLMKKLPYPSSNSHGLLRKATGVVATVALVALSLMFSILLLVMVLVAGLGAWGYWWWRTRDLRKYDSSGNEVGEGDAIAGEVIGEEIMSGKFIRGKIIEGEVIRRTDFHS